MSNNKQRDQGMKKISKFGALAVSFVTLAHTVKSAEISHNINVGAGVGWTLMVGLISEPQRLILAVIRP